MKTAEAEDYKLSKRVEYWAGRLIGYDQAIPVAKEIVEAINYAESHVSQQQSKERGLKILTNGDVVTQEGNVIGDASSYVKKVSEEIEELKTNLKRSWEKQFKCIKEIESQSLLLSEAREALEEISGFPLLSTYLAERIQQTLKKLNNYGKNMD